MCENYSCFKVDDDDDTREVFMLALVIHVWFSSLVGPK